MLMVQEFTLLKSHNTVFKLIGPSLVPQDANEAKANVEKRLEFIKNEMYVSLLLFEVETCIDGLEKG